MIIFEIRVSDVDLSSNYFQKGIPKPFRMSESYFIESESACPSSHEELSSALWVSTYWVKSYIWQMRRHASGEEDSWVDASSHVQLLIGEEDVRERGRLGVDHIPVELIIPKISGS